MSARPGTPSTPARDRRNVVRIAALTLALPLAAACGLSGLVVQEPVAPSVGYFAGEPPTIHEGAITSLVWNVYGHPEPITTIDHDIGDVPLYARRDVAPTATTTYTLTATNRRGTDSATATVVVYPPLESDGLEPDDDAASAIPIGPSYLSPLRTITPGDVDWYAFTIDDRALVTVWLQTETVGPTLRAWYGILDADLVGLAIYGDGSDPQYDGDRPIALDAGTYFVAVTGVGDGPFFAPTFNGSHRRAGTYRLAVAAVME